MSKNTKLTKKDRKRIKRAMKESQNMHAMFDRGLLGSPGIGKTSIMLDEYASPHIMLNAAFGSDSFSPSSPVGKHLHFIGRAHALPEPIVMTRRELDFACWHERMHQWMADTILFANHMGTSVAEVRTMFPAPTQEEDN